MQLQRVVEVQPIVRQLYEPDFSTLKTEDAARQNLSKIVCRASEHVAENLTYPLAWVNAESQQLNRTSGSNSNAPTAWRPEKARENLSAILLGHKTPQDTYKLLQETETLEDKFLPYPVPRQRHGLQRRPRTDHAANLRSYIVHDLMLTSVFSLGSGGKDIKDFSTLKTAVRALVDITSEVAPDIKTSPAAHDSTSPAESGANPAPQGAQTSSSKQAEAPFPGASCSKWATTASRSRLLWLPRQGSRLQAAPGPDEILKKDKEEDFRHRQMFDPLARPVVVGAFGMKPNGMVVGRGSPRPLPRELGRFERYTTRPCGDSS
mmetsp:Transcript_25670/g.64685  ORF Transcript_25670/g.64685 Transcript_25670/m.64685 type:complete len:320 (+) Transcript_25670:400-1359(+)